MIYLWNNIIINILTPNLDVSGFLWVTNTVYVCAKCDYEIE